MGDLGKFSLMLIPIGLAGNGDFVAAREAAFHIDDEATRNSIINMVDEIQGKGTNPEESGHH